MHTRTPQRKKRMAVDIKKFLALDQLRKDLLVAVEDMRAKKNSVSKRVPVMKGKEKEEAIKEMKELDRNLEAKEEELTRTESGWQEMQLFLPSIPLDSVPVGKDDTENVKLRTWGEVPTFDFEPKDHIALGEALDIIDIPRGVKIAGSRSYVLKGDGARLELAVLLFTIDHLQKKGFTPFLPPLLANYEAMMGTSYFGRGGAGLCRGCSEAERRTHGERRALAHRDVRSVRCQLPSRRDPGIFQSSEALCGHQQLLPPRGGNLRQGCQRTLSHPSISKVEQVVLCEADPEVSAKMHAELLQNAEEVLQALKLPYRVVAVCTGDMGRGQVYKNDIETWMPSRKAYGETHSCSTFHDFQARRLGIKYEDKDGKRNSSTRSITPASRAPRILIPLLEIHQKENGSISIPEVLQPYMNGKKEISA